MRIVKRQRGRHAGLVVLGRDHPDVVGNLARNLLADLEAVGVDAVVVGDQDAHTLSLPPPLAGEVGDRRSPGGGNWLMSNKRQPPPQPSSASGGGRREASARDKQSH